MKPDGDLILLDSLQFINNTFLSIPLEEPLPITYRKVFAGLVGKLKSYAHCSHGLHLMGNVIFDQDKNPVMIETNYLYVRPGSDKYFLQAPKIYKDAEKNYVDNQLPQYVPLTCKNPVKADGWYARLKRLLADCPKCSPTVRSSSGWVHFFEKFNEQSAESVSKGAVLQDIHRSTDKILVMVLSDPTQMRPCGQLGTVLLWNTADEKIKVHCKMRFTRLKTAVRHLSVFISQLLQSQYGVQNDIYLYQSEINNETRPKFNEIESEPDLNVTDNRPELLVTG
jgi:hypothetical protein